jgi:hypothetical protein
MSAELIALLREQRKSWVDLEPGKRVQIIRPAEADMQDFDARDGYTAIDRMVACAAKYVTGWDGITRADLLGAAHAGPDPVPFSAELWAEVVRDRNAWLMAVSHGLIEAIAAHQAAKEQDAKN